MNPELLSMSNKELIEWACKYGTIEEKELRKTFSDIEAYCAQRSVSVAIYIQYLVALSNAGIRGKKAAKMLRKQLCRLWVGQRLTQP